MNNGKRKGPGTGPCKHLAERAGVQCTNVLRPLVCGWYQFRLKKCEKCAVPECDTEDVVAGQLTPSMTQAPRAGHQDTT